MSSVELLKEGTFQMHKQMRIIVVYFCYGACCVPHYNETEKLVKSEIPDIQENKSRVPSGVK